MYLDNNKKLPFLMFFNITDIMRNLIIKWIQLFNMACADSAIRTDPGFTHSKFTIFMQWTCGWYNTNICFHWTFSFLSVSHIVAFKKLLCIWRQCWIKICVLLYNLMKIQKMWERILFYNTNICFHWTFSFLSVSHNTT